MKLLITAMLLLVSSSLSAASFDDDLKELFALTGVKNNYASVNTFILSRLQNGYFKAADENINPELFSEAQRIQASEILKEKFALIVENYEAYVKDVMSYEDVINEVYIPLYKEKYTSSDVKELLKFYRSPVGRKSLDVAKDIAGEASERIANKYDPVVVPFMEKQIEEHIGLAKNEIAEKIK